MDRLGLRERILAVLLSALAGYIDAIGFVKAGGFFVSFMSGNSTRLAVGFVKGSPSILVAAGLILAFVLGVAFGTAVAERTKSPARTVLWLVSATLAVAGVCDLLALPEAIFIAAIAMGAENAIFARGSEVQIGLTYMTGTLVKLGQNIAYALLGRPNTRWISFGLLWLGLVLGAVLGAFVSVVAERIGFLSAAIAAAGLSYFISAGPPQLKNVR